MCARVLNKEEIIAIEPGTKFLIKFPNRPADTVEATMINKTEYWLYFDVPEYGEDGEDCEQLIDCIEEDGKWFPVYGDGEYAIICEVE